MNKDHDYSPSPSFDDIRLDTTISEWKTFGVENSQFSASQLARHFFILGETGSGKTVSGLVPILKSTLDSFSSASNDLRPFVFVIDPKHELVAILKERSDWKSEIVELSLNKDKYKVDFFEGYDRDTITAENVVEAIRDIFFNPSKEDKDRYWEEWAANFIQLVIQIDIDLHRKGKSFSEEYYKASIRIKQDRDQFVDDPYAQSMDTASFSALCANRGMKGKARNDVYFERIKQFVGLVNASRVGAFKVLEDVIAACQLSPSFIDEFSPLVSMSMETFGAISSFVTKSLNRLSSPQINRHVWFCPYLTAKNTLCIDKLMDLGTILVFHPSLANLDSSSIVAKCIKTKVFETVFYRKNKERPVLYICDEFQRFITNDPVSGEQSFLDRCRAYRTICVLATQSISSLAYAVGGANVDRVSTSLDIIMTNTGNKLFFRSTDEMVVKKLSSLIPYPSLHQKTHVLNIRPPATLAVGECYYVFSSGKWGRKQVSIDDES